jgi:hypothetical protein
MKIFLPIIGFIFSIQAYSQNTSFVKLILNDSSDQAQSAFQLSSGDYFMLYNTNSSGQGDKDFGITRTDGLGNMKWSYTYGKSNRDSATKMSPTSDGGVVVCGYTEGSLNNKDGFVSKISSSGTLQWSKTFKTDSSEQLFDVIQSLSGEYYACGYVKTDSLDDNILICKLTSNGNVSWTRSFGGKGSERGYSLLEDSRGRIVIAGNTENDSVNIGSNGDSDFQLLAISTAGGVLSSKNIGSSNSEYAIKIIRSQDNKFYVAGDIKLNGGNDEEILICKLDTNFDVLSSELLGTNLIDQVRDLKLGENNSIVLAISATTPFSSDAILCNLSSLSNISPGQKLGGMDLDGQSGVSIMGSSTRGFSLFTSGVSLGNTSSEDLYLTKIPKSFDISCASDFESVQSMGGLSLSKNTFSQITSLNSNASISFTKNKFNSNDSTVCCSLEARVTGDTVSICAGTSINIGRSSISGYKYSWVSTTGSSFTSSTANPSVSPTDDTEYKLVVNSSDGLCKSDSAIILVKVKSRMSQKFLSDTFFCDGSSIDISGMKGMLLYEWEKGNGDKINTSSITLSNADTLNLLMIDNNTCKYYDTLLVEQKSLPTFSLGNDTTICDNLSVTFTGPPNMQSYTWNDVASSNQNYTTNISKVHSLSVVDSFGCIYSDNIQVLTNPSSNINIGRDTAFCEGLTIEFFGPSFFTGYKWNGISSSQNLYSTNIDTMVYVEAYNSFGCPAFDTVQIHYFDIPKFSFGADTGFCDVVDYQLIGPVNMKDYLWYNGSSADKINVRGPGLYYLEVTNNDDCSFTDSIFISKYESPIISLGNDTALRTTDPLILTPGSGYDSYSWSTGETTERIEVVAKNKYSVTVIDSNGCSGYAEMRVTSSAGNQSIEHSQISIFPTPADNRIVINSENLVGKGYLVISNIFGQEVVRNSFDRAKKIVDVSELIPGTYKLTLCYPNQIYHQTIIISR